MAFHSLNPARPATTITSAIFQINITRLHVTLVTLSINDIIKFLEKIKQGFKRTVSWNKYSSEITTQLRNNNLDYMKDPTFGNISRLFVLSLKNSNNDPSKDSFGKYYMALV